MLQEATTVQVPVSALAAVLSVMGAGFLSGITLVGHLLISIKNGQGDMRVTVAEMGKDIKMLAVDGKRRDEEMGEIRTVLFSGGGQR